MPAEPRPPTSPLGCFVLGSAALVGPPVVAALLGLCVRVFRWAAWGG